MLVTAKSAVKKTKKFVKDHPTLTACAVTFVVASKLSHDTTLNGVMKESRKFAYEKGQHAGALEAFLDASYTFIDRKGLTEEFMNFTQPTG